VNGWGQLAQFNFPATNSLVVSANDPNVTVGNIGLSTGTIETNITTGTYFPNEPYIEETGGWTSNNQSSAKSFQFTINANSGYVFSITNIYFRAYATSAGPSAFGIRIGSIDIYSVNAPDASIVVIDQAITSQSNLTSITINIQGWLNGSRITTGSGVFRLDDLIITGTVTPASSDPTIIGSATASAFTTTYGTASAAQNFSVSGSNLTANLVATAPTGFEVSSDGTTYGSTATFTQSGGSASGTLRVRLSASAAVGSYNSLNVELSSTGATSVNITTASTGNTVSQKALTVTGLTAQNKTYDASTTASTTGTAVLSGIVGSDDVSLTGTPSFTFATAAVGTGKTVSTSGYTLGGTNAANYTLTQPSFTANITAKSLSITTATIASKIYNGSAASGTVTPGTLSGFVVTETVVVSSATGVYADANVGTGKIATVTYTLGNGSNGGLATNYSLASTSATGDITKANQTITFAALADKFTTDANFNCGATSTTSGTNPLSYSSSNTSVATISSSGVIDVLTEGTTTITVSQAGNSNYNAAADVAQILNVIVPPCLSENFESNSLSNWTTAGGTTGGGTATAVNGGSGDYYLNLNENGEWAQLPASQTYNSISFSIKGSSTSNSWTLKVQTSSDGITWSDVGGSGTISGSLIGTAYSAQTVSFSPITNFVRLFLVRTSNSCYIGFLDAYCTSAPEINVKQASTNLLSGSGSFAYGSVMTGTSSSAITFTVENVGSETLDLTGTPKIGISGNTSDFAINELSTSASITAGGNTTFTVTFSPTSDGAKTATISIANNDSNENPYTFNVTGTGISSSLNAVTLGSALTTTYGTASSGVSFTASGTNLTENITVTAQSGYEVSTSAGAGYGASVSVAGGTTVYVRFASTKTPGTFNTVTAAILSTNGATNVNVTTSSSANTISVKTLTVTGLTALDKVYNGLTTASTTGTAALSGVIGTDVVSLSGTPAFTFASANVGSGISVSTSGYTLTGANASYYTLTQPSFTASITVRALTITANDVNKLFGETLSGATGSTAFTSSGLQNGQTIGSVTIAYGTGAASGDAVGTYSGQVTPSAATGGTFSASNYSITYVSGAINVSLYAVGDYRTRASGNWGVSSSWEKWNGSSWIACAGSDFPNSSSVNVTIRSGHTIDNDGSAGSPWEVRNLTVESVAQLWDNSFAGNNDYIEIFGDIVCDGTIGSPNGDDISFEIAGGNDCQISGSGSFTATRIRKSIDLNPTQNTTLNIAMDIRLTWSSGSGTVLYNGSDCNSTGSMFNVTVAAGKTVRCSGPGVVTSGVSIDGLYGTYPEEAGGIYTIYGTLDMDGPYYSVTNNSNLSYPTSLVIKNGGTVKCRYIETGSSGAAGNTLRIEPGGKLNIFGSVDTISATLNDITWNGYSTTNNTLDFQSGSTIEYSGATQQRVNGITSCSNFTVSGGGLKKLGNDFTVASILTLTSGRVQTDAYKLIHSSTAAADLTHTTGSASFIFGTYRRYLASNTSTYEMPVGLSSATAGFRRADLMNNNLGGLTYVDASVRSITETGDNIDSRITCSQFGTALTDIIGNTVWTLQPNASPASGTYGVRLYVNGTGMTAADDNTFCAVKRPDNSTDYADWNTLESTTTIPSSGAAGRIYNGGTGYAERIGYTSFSEHAIGKTMSNQPLPVELHSFSANCSGEGNIKLAWVTASENNSSHFVIENSTNGNEWEVAGVLNAAGSSQQILEYEFEFRTHANLDYFRLKQVDMDGEVVTYPEISVVCSPSYHGLVTIPNPSGNEFTMVYDSNVNNSHIEVQLSDIQGRHMYSKRFNVSEGLNFIALNGKDWPSGMYYLKVTSSDGTVQLVRHRIL
jgi:hypothetical protein